MNQNRSMIINERPSAIDALTEHSALILIERTRGDCYDHVTRKAPGQIDSLRLTKHELIELAAALVRLAQNDTR